MPGIFWLLLFQANLGFADIDSGLMALANGDVEKAIAEFTPAAEAGSMLAQYNLATIHAEGRGIEKDEEKGLQWYLKAAETGHRDSQYAVGFMQLNGLGVPQSNPEEAVRWFRHAAGQGHAAAQFSLGPDVR